MAIGPMWIVGREMRRLAPKTPQLQGWATSQVMVELDVIS